jgi:uncharacterized protein YndB with AHSA1/START domain
LAGVVTLGIAPFEFDRSWEFPVDPDEFWAIVSHTDSFPLWWGWLRAFESEGLSEGAKTDFVVQGALPYQLHFVVVIDRLVEARLVETSVSGDVEGPASLEIEPAPEGCVATLRWTLEPQERVLRRLAMLSHHLLSWSHDQVVAMGVTQFRRRLARSTG